MRHLVFSYHTDPLEEPGTELAGGMNIYLRGLLSSLQLDTLVLTSGRKFEELQLGRAVIWRIPCRGKRWDREAAYAALPRFIDDCRERLDGFYPSLSAHYWMSGLAARALFPDRPPVMMFHSLDPGGNERRAEAERELAAACPTVFSSALDRAVSASKLPGLQSVHVIRPGCDPAFVPHDQARARQRLGLPLRGTLVGLPARDDPAKNAALARQACHESGVTLIQTPGPLWPDGLPHSEMPWFYSAMDAVLSLSEYETFGLSVLEALACGCRVLVAPRGYWSGIARHTGLLRVASDDPGRDLAALLRDPPPDPALARHHFSWERAARRWKALLNLVKG